MSVLTYPTKLNSVLAAVVADLLQQQHLSGKTCWLEHGSSRLSHHIWVLNRSGWPIQWTDVIVPTSDGRRVMIRQYYLPPEVIALEGGRGQAFARAVRDARNVLKGQAA